MNSVAHALFAAGLSLALVGSARAQDKSFTVTLVPPVHGKVQLTPALPADGKYPAGTVVTVAATPIPATRWIRRGTRCLDDSGRCITRA